MATQNPASYVVDQAAQVASLDSYQFLGAGGNATLTGYYVNAYNNQVGTSFTQTINAASGTQDPYRFLPSWGGLTTFNGGDIDTNVVGWVGTIQGSPLYLGLLPPSTPASTNLADLKANYVNYPQKPVSTYTYLGRVA